MQSNKTQSQWPTLAELQATDPVRYQQVVASAYGALGAGTRKDASH